MEMKPAAVEAAASARRWRRGRRGAQRRQLRRDAREQRKVRFLRARVAGAGLMAAVGTKNSAASRGQRVHCDVERRVEIREHVRDVLVSHRFEFE